MESVLSDVRELLFSITCSYVYSRGDIPEIMVEIQVFGPAFRSRRPVGCSLSQS
jgi:hypothetical protein